MRRTLLALIAALALLSGCAGDKDKGDGVASAGDGKAASASAKANEGDAAEQAAKYAGCMRENGVDIPDPQVDGEGRVAFGVPLGGNGTADEEKVRAAQEKCRQHLPNGGEPPQMSADELEKMRKFSQCMRENGFPDFPDPQPDGGIRIERDQVGPAPDSQQWKDAHKKCEQHMPAPPGSDQKKDGS